MTQQQDPSSPGTGTPEGVSQRSYPRFPELGGAHVFITGGGSGIGAFLVHAFAQQGASTSFVSLSAPEGEKLAQAIADQGLKRPWFRPCDIRDPEALRGAIEGARAHYGPVGVLINNAARDDRHSLASLSPEGWDDSMATNLRPYFFTAQAIAPDMRSLGGGAIINLGSNSATLGLSGYPAYVTAKAAILGLTRALARELGPDGIRVNALVPGWVMTKRQIDLWVNPEDLAECLAQQSLKRTITGEDVAGPALFLASDNAAMITGQTLLVDGGRAMP